MKRIKKKIKALSKKNYFLKNLMAKIETRRQNRYYKKLARTLPVDDKMIIFEAFFAKKYACSPKAIYEYMRSDPRYSDFKFVWVFRNPDAPEIKELFKGQHVILLRYKTKKYYRFYARAKYWVTNARIPDCIVRKPEQVYIQCWHGTPLKKLGWDIDVKGNNALSSNKEVRRQYNHDASRYSYMLSPSRFCSEKLTSAFNLKALGKADIMVEQGYPRNDELFTFDDDKVRRIKESLGLPLDKKVILYAPTWRDNQHQLGVGYTFDVGIDLKDFQRRFGDEYVILMRMHYLIANSMNLHSVADFAFNVSDYNNVNDLYIISDILITDYSSVFFDYANLRRPMIFYMYDLDEYQGNTRDFYISLDELPGAIVKTNEELADAIINIDALSEKYADTYQAFHDKFNYLDDAEASKRVVEHCIKA